MKTANHPVDSWPTLAEGYLEHCNNRHKKKHPPPAMLLTPIQAASSDGSLFPGAT
jgi:hypothetical protein